MNPNSLTALIITCHNLSALLTVVLTVIIGLVAYALFIRRLKEKKRTLIISLALGLLIGWALSDKLLGHPPLKLELVSVG